MSVASQMERLANLGGSLTPCNRGRPGERRENFTSLHCGNAWRFARLAFCRLMQRRQACSL
ncbi:MULTISPECIES: hypothetical protein [unclassified Bradyrhizobium]|uniref:hypothetical protein n=1 Tax=unclassified Bradyrhizobium TaxID=2631580 RepID=UPI0015C9981A|nr:MULTISPECIES: hypothetical protein [unclassified Bradyrhizobium]MBB4263865.1 hypothetical protein [Bradyrhizobium sp. CIR3A]NYG49212.1 hypothetical protein [Bradyrhizobium sp. IAR9]